MTTAKLPDSTDRDTVDYVLFGAGFLGFLLAAAGVVLGALLLAGFGGGLLLLVVLIFQLRSTNRE